MAINREARDQIADALAAVMRGDLTIEEFRARAGTIREIYTRLKHEDTDAFESLALSMKAGSPIDSGNFLTHEYSWNEFSRVAAVLKSDLVTLRKHEVVHPIAWIRGVAAVAVLVAWNVVLYQAIGLCFGLYMMGWLLPAFPLLL